MFQHLSYRSPSPQQTSYNSINKANKNVYYHHRKTNLDRNANNVEDREDMSHVSAIWHEQLDNKSEILRNNNHTTDTTSKQVQMAVHSLNINQRFRENTDKRKGTQLHTSGHGIQQSEPQYFSVKGKCRHSVYRPISVQCCQTQQATQVTWAAHHYVV